MRQDRVLFRHQMIAESPPKPFPHCRIASCSRHTRIFIRAPGCRPCTSAPVGNWGCQEDKNGLQLRTLLQSSAFRRSLVALALCSTAIVASVSPASARSHHGAGRLRSCASRRPSCQAALRHHRHSRPSRAPSRWERGVAQMQAHGLADANASVPSGAVLRRHGGMPSGFGSSDLVCRSAPLSRRQSDRSRQPVVRALHEHGAAAHRPSRHRLGHGEFVREATASASPGPQVGAIAVMGRRGGGHVGIITGIDAPGNPIMISGNNGNRVREAPVSRGRIYAYVMPTG